jgi:hypothetical protein
MLVLSRKRGAKKKVVPMSEGRIATPHRSKTGDSSLGANRPGDDDHLGAAALKVLQSSSYAALRRLRCDAAEAVVIIRGVLPSYYLKQMAQAAIQRLEGVQSVMNLVEVRVSEGVQLVWDDENNFSREVPPPSSFFSRVQP